MILTTPINGNADQVFLNQKALGLHAEKMGGVLYVQNALKCRPCHSKFLFYRGSTR